MALENVITTLVLDVIDHDQTQGIVKAIALDSKTRYVKATLVQHGIDYPVDESATVTLTILRPDNVGVQVTGSVVDVDNADRTGTIKGVYAELTQAALAKSGTLRAQFKVTSGEQILRTEIFLVKNGIALDGETSEWADQYEGYNLDELVQTVNDVVTTVTGMETDVSDLKEDLREYADIFTGDVDESVQNWMDEHPEAALQDGGVTTQKLADNAVTNSKLAADLKKPWYKLTDITMFGRVASANLPVLDSYPEAITYDTTRNLIYVATYDYSDSVNTADIIALDADTLQIVNTYYYRFGTIGALSYNPKTDQIYVAITGGVYKLYAINAVTMESLGELTDKVFSAGVQYDIELGVNVALQLSGTTAEIRTYDDNFDQIARYTVPIESTDTVQQDFCAKNGILYICTWSSILEIDYVNGLINRVGLAGFARGNEEPEGTCFVGDELYLLSFRAGTGGKFELFKYGFSSIINLTNSSLYNSYALNVSSIVEEYPTLFSFIQSMNVGDTAHLYHYSPTGNFSDLPTLYSGDAWISEIYVNRSTQTLEYTQIELSMHRVASDQNVWKRWRGIIKNSYSASITWAEYQMANPYAMGTTIPSGSDLNDYTAPGVYAVTSSSIANNISHMPVAAAGRLEVRESIASGTGTYVVQTYFRTNTTDCEIYHRVKTTAATGFGSWNKVAYAS